MCHSLHSLIFSHTHYRPFTVLKCAHQQLLCNRFFCLVWVITVFAQCSLLWYVLLWVVSRSIHYPTSVLILVTSLTNILKNGPSLGVHLHENMNAKVSENGLCRGEVSHQFMSMEIWRATFQKRVSEEGRSLISSCPWRREGQRFRKRSLKRGGLSSVHVHGDVKGNASENGLWRREVSHQFMSMEMWRATLQKTVFEEGWPLIRAPTLATDNAVSGLSFWCQS